MKNMFCQFISKCGIEKLFLILLLIISLIKYIFNKMIFNTFPKIELEQNDYKKEIDINKSAIKYLNTKSDFVYMSIILSIFALINTVIYKILFNNFLYFYSIIIGCFLQIMCIVSCLYSCVKKRQFIIDSIFQVSKDILSLLILKSLVYSQFTSKKVFKEYHYCILYYIKFYFVYSLFILIYSFFRRYYYSNELFITCGYFLSILIIYIINIFFTVFTKSENMLKFSYMLVANILAFMFIFSIIGNFTIFVCCAQNINYNKYLMILSNEANAINLIILMAANYRLKKYFKEN